MARVSAGKAKARAKTPANVPRAQVVNTPPPKLDPRRVIYPVLDLVFALAQAILIWKVVPNRLPSASFHLWTLPVFYTVMAIGTARGGRYGWWIAVIGGSAALLSATLLIVRIVISAAFLSGVYGAFGKAAAMTAMIAVALLVEMVVLLPIVQVKFLLSRIGKRALGVP